MKCSIILRCDKTLGADITVKIIRKLSTFRKMDEIHMLIFLRLCIFN